MKLDEKYIITTEPNNWILKELAVDKDGNAVLDKKGKQVENILGFYPKLKYALIKYLDETLKPCEDAQAILNRIEEVEALIETIKVKE